MEKKFSILLVLGLIFSSTLAGACIDYSGDYNREGLHLRLNQMGCNSLNIVEQYPNQIPLSDDYKISSVPTVDGWSWSNGNLTLTQTMYSAGSVSKTEVFTYTLDNAKNLLEHLVEYPVSAEPIDHGIIAVYQRL